MVASQFSGKDNTTLSDFPNYFVHGSRYSVLAPFFSFLSTLCLLKYAYNPFAL